MNNFVDPYADEASGVLFNLVDATSQAELEAAEAALTFARSLELPHLTLAPTRDLNELRGIHRHLFQDVYAWAGQTRILDTMKNVGRAQPFLPVSRLESATHNVMAGLAEDSHLRGFSRPEFVERIAFHYDQLNYIHPFREGNGRVQRVFWDRVAVDAGRLLDWTRVTGAVNDAASRIAAEEYNLGPLVEMFDDVVDLP